MDRRLTTILAADMVGYSRLMAADEEGVIGRLRAARAEIIDPAIAEAGGRIVKTMGDGLLVEFPSPLAAVRMAVDVQTAMLARESIRAEADRFRFRIGVNTGEIVIDGDDILGDAVNIAARLESLAPPGGICIGRSAHDQIIDQVDAPLTALGPQMVKNIPDPVDVWRVEIAGVKAPALAKKAERPSIAVLPFDNMSADPDQEFLADGIVEDVITELSRFRSLLVIARNSTFAYKGAHKDVREIAKELDVRYVVEGSVRRAGNRLRVTAQLIEASTGAHLWAERWDRTMEDLFDLQDELTHAIVTAVEPELGAHERGLARSRPTDNLSAWELCQRGYTEFSSYSAEGLANAARLLKAAIEADANFALPHVYLAQTFRVRISSGRATDAAADAAKGLSHARKAIEIDDRLELGYGTLGVFLAIAEQEAEAKVAVETAIRLNPNHALCRYCVAMVNAFLTEPDGAAIYENCQAALALSPKDPLAHMFRFTGGYGLLHVHWNWTNPKMLAAFRSAASDPKADYFLHYFAAVACIVVDNPEAAKTHIAAALERMPSLTINNFASRFSFRSFARVDATIDPYKDQLAALGMPLG